jgi:hypothetical protein
MIGKLEATNHPVRQLAVKRVTLRKETLLETNKLKVENEPI